MRIRNALTIAGLALVLCACKPGAVREGVPARISNAGPESHAELQRVVSTLLNGKDVTIADNALTDSSLLIVEPSHLMGRDLRKPEQFRLVLKGSSCVLVHLGTNSRVELSGVSCTAE